MTMAPTEPLPARQAEYLRLGFEARGLEFKESVNWGEIDERLHLIRTFMAMSNLRDGGAVVIGVRENNDGTYRPEGMEERHYDSFVPGQRGGRGRSVVRSTPRDAHGEGAARRNALRGVRDRATG